MIDLASHNDFIRFKWDKKSGYMNDVSEQESESLHPYNNHKKIEQLSTQIALTTANA